MGQSPNDASGIIGCQNRLASNVGYVPRPHYLLTLSGAGTWAGSLRQSVPTHDCPSPRGIVPKPRGSHIKDLGGDRRCRPVLRRLDVRACVIGLSDPQRAA